MFIEFIERIMRSRSGRVGLALVGFAYAVLALYAILPRNVLAYDPVLEFFGGERALLLLSLTLMVVGLAVLMAEYLSTGFTGRDVGVQEGFRGSSYELRRLSEGIDSVRDAIANQKGMGPTPEALTEDDRSELLSLITDRLDRELRSGILKEIESKYSAAVLEETRLRDLRERFEETKSRLSSEVLALARRGNLNLMIGTISTLAAVSLLAYTALNADVDSSSMSDLAAYYVPRISVIVFIEIFAFFFLRLYKSNLEESKYFQNELTNVEARFVAFEGALHTGDKAVLDGVIQKLAETERNFVLSEGETTVELEKAKFENQTLRDVMGAASGIVATRWKRQKG